MPAGSPLSDLVLGPTDAFGRMGSTPACPPRPEAL